jgi:MFS family permease
MIRKERKSVPEEKIYSSLTSGLGWGSHWLIDQTLWAEVTPDEERGRIFGLAEATVAMVAVIAALAGGWLISNLGPVTALTAIGLTIAIGALAVSFIGGGYRTIGRIQKV